MLESFRPRIGDYFFIDITINNIKEDSGLGFPSPHWGLFFYHIKF